MCVGGGGVLGMVVFFIHEEGGVRVWSIGGSVDSVGAVWMVGGGLLRGG